ncbi:MAG: hypothetical protein V4507_01880 [Verrucomicrobiota bacterium]
MKENEDAHLKKEEDAIEIPADQVEVIHVSPENIHLENESQRPREQASSFHFKTYSFGQGSDGQPIKISLWKPLLGCAFFLLLLFGIFAGLLMGIFQLLQKLISLIF